MKKKILSVLVLSLTSGIGFSQQATASEIGEGDYFSVSAPSFNAWTAPEIPGYNEKFGVFEKNKVQDINEISFGADFEMFTLEGFQNFKNIKLFHNPDNNVTDLYPLEKLRNLEEIELFSMRVPISDLSTLGELKKLKKINLKLGDFESTGKDGSNESIYTIGQRAGVTDLSPLNKLNKLENLYLATEGYFPPVTLKKGQPHYELINPVILSKQFKGAEVEYAENNRLEELNDELDVENQVLHWKNISTETKYLGFSANARVNEYSFQGNYLIPIRWTD